MSGASARIEAVILQPEVLAVPAVVAERVVLTMTKEDAQRVFAFAGQTTGGMTDVYYALAGVLGGYRGAFGSWVKPEYSGFKWVPRR